MQYRSVADLNDDIVRYLHRFPREIELVVGVPRSGLLAGAMLALALNVPLGDVDGVIDGRVLSTGRTRRRPSFDLALSDIHNVLVIDDSINSGNSLSDVRKRLQSTYPEKAFTFCAVYGTGSQHPNVDIVLEVVPHPRVFQWNFMHHDLLERCCVDIDGVLCVDPTESENDDGKK
jgi:hypoxanthine phosphoribosyltransferase